MRRLASDGEIPPSVRRASGDAAGLRDTDECLELLLIEHASTTTWFRHSGLPHLIRANRHARHSEFLPCLTIRYVHIWLWSRLKEIGPMRYLLAADAGGTFTDIVVR